MYGLKRVFHPEIYQGHHKKANYFEGWYFKCITSDRSQSLAVIPGIAMDSQGERHAFIQLIHAQSGQCYYFRYPFSSFSAVKDTFAVQIEANHFSRTGLSLAIDQPDGKVSGQLSFDQIVPYPTQIWHPGIMGPYSFVPGMECYHGILNIDHRISGQLTIDGNVFDFDNGRGYIEKDYGRSFPANWVWLQANHFSRPGVTFMFSRAAIPFMGTIFQGLISFISLDGKIYRFATYNRAKMTHYAIDRENMTVSAMMENKHGQLSFTAFHRGGGILRAPKNGQMDRKINESITARLELVWHDKHGRKILADQSDQVGMEISDE